MYTSYCIPGLKHSVTGVGCKVCSSYWLLKREETSLAEPIYPLKASCIRSMKINHDTGCYTCQWKREITPCTLQLTKFTYNEDGSENKDILGRLNSGYCLHCDSHHEVDPRNLETACSEGRVSAQPYYRCKHTPGKRHWWCKYHKGITVRHICCRCLNEERNVHYQGQVTSHQTGNHTTAANAGGNMTTINYYGTNYTLANNPSQQHMDPTAIGSGIAGALEPMNNFIASPTVEELAGDQSDRLMMIMAGNSSLITQEAAAGAVAAYGCTPSYLEPQANTVDLPTRPGPSCDRLYTLDSLEWKADTKSIIIPFPGILSNTGVFGTNLQFHYLYRAGFMAHIQVNATQFHAGTLIAAIVPECTMTSLASSGLDVYEKFSFFTVRTSESGYELPQGFIDQLPIFPHQVINLRTNNSATIVWPYNNITPASCFTTHNIARLVICVLSPLQSPEGSTQVVPITVTIQPICSQFNGLRNRVERQGVPTFSIPGSEQFGTTLANSGFPAYPVWEPVPKFPIAGRCNNFLSVARIPTYIYNTDNSTFYWEITNKMPDDELILDFDLSLLSNDFQGTYIARLARMFAFYRGTLDFKFLYCGPRQSTGKVLVAYTPPGGAKPTTREEAMLGTHIIWDFGLQSTLSFPVPYVSVSPYRYANRTGDIFSYDGWITMWYQTAVVVAPGCQSAVRFLATLCAGDDFSLRGYMDTAYYQGLGDALQNAIDQTVSNQIVGALNALPPAPTQPSAGMITQQEQHGHATALEALETGVSMLNNPSSAQVIEPGSVMNLSPNDTSLANMLSRYMFIYGNKISIGNTASYGQVVIPLDFNTIINSGNMVKTLFRSMTYWRFDVDIVVMFSSPTNGRMKVMFAPPGSYTSTTDDLRFRGINPQFSALINGPPVSFRVPYMVPTSYLCSVFDGFGSYTPEQSNYGNSAAQNFGNILVTTMGQQKNIDITVQVFARPVNIEAYMPRPIMPAAQAASTTSSRGRLEVGDPENFVAPDNFEAIAMCEGEDPLPAEYPEGPDFPYGEWSAGEWYPAYPMAGRFWWSPWFQSIRLNTPIQQEIEYHHLYIELIETMWDDDIGRKFFRWEIIEQSKNEYMRNVILADMYEVCRKHVLSSRGRTDDGYSSDVEYQGLLKNAADTVAESFSTAFKGAMEKLKATEADIKMDWWAKALGIATKFVAFAVLVMKSRSDPTVLAAVGALVAVDIADACPFSWIKDEICKMVGIAHKQGPTNFFRDFNTMTNAAKGVDWLITKIKELVDWIANKIKPKVEELEKDACDLELLADNLREWRLYQTNPTDYTEASVIDLAQNLVLLRDKLERTDPNSQALRYIAPTMTSVQKFLANTKHRKCEPIGVVFHGTPGCGKSLATQMLGKNMSKYYGGDIPYSLPPDPKYFDNYTCQPVVIMDDLGQNPDGEDMKMFCQMISSTDYITPQADNPDKGRPFLSRLVLASTNCDKLRPPTISHPTALERRFAFDLDVVSFPSYQSDGKLDMEKAFEPCDHDSLCYKGCCPFICGRAIAFKDRRNKEILSLDQLTLRIRRLDKEKMALSTKMDVFLQGPVVKGKILRRVNAQDLSTMGRKPLTKDIENLIETAPDRKAMIQYAYDLGYDIPEDMLCGNVLSITREVASAWKIKMLTIGAILAILTTALLVWRMMPASQEGPYDGLAQRRLVAPQRRVVEAQGNTDPDSEFAVSLMRHNLFGIETSTGRYTALGIYGKTVVLPSHAAVGPYYVDGKEIKPDEEYDLCCRGLSTELTVLKFPALQDFKDIRKFSVLAINSDAFPRTMVPVRKIYPYGVLNLEGVSTTNTLYYTTPTRRGYCGGVIVKAGKIIGMHIAGDGTNGYAAFLKASYFTELQGEIVKKSKAPVSINVNTKTSLQPSVYHHLIDVKKEPAILSSRDPRCEVDFNANLFNKYKGNPTSKPPYLEEVCEQYAEQLRPILPPNLLEPLTLDEAVDGFGRLDGLALETSAGFPYCTQGIRKRHLVDNNKSKLIEGLNLHGFDLPYVTCLKDELRSKDKVRTGNTRLIECSSVNDTIRAKMVFGRLYEAMISNPGAATGSAVGCNPDIHWTKFAADMGSNVFAFDYKNFDASLGPVWFDGLKYVLRLLGYGEDAMRVINHMCRSTHIFKDIEYVVEGGMPSGCSGTSIFNSMINNLIIKAIALEAYKGIDLDQLKIIAYGDDVIISYPYKLDPGVFAEIGAKYGLTITPADKGDHFGEPGDITGVTFLKRHFKPDDVYPFLYHPVFPMDEILQSLAWTRDPRTMPEHVRSLAYLAWHAGETDYKKFVDLIRSVPVGRAFQLPTFKMLRHEWIDGF
uniref:Genome polyprotein n=1 Tax=Sharp-tailed sandpiper Picornavirus B-like TaxID=2592521 RepID=A0A5B8KCW5_9PICO|nr:polyprotein [Sharp-tailed sandpiper Picornavirus B-like]